LGRAPDAGLSDRAQRVEVFRELALVKADDPVDPSADPVGAAVLPYEAAVAPSLPVPQADTAAPEEDLLSKVGRGRMGRFGISAFRAPIGCERS
jgi:hypothetical protein